jgi:hypothetical protein
MAISNRIRTAAEWLISLVRARASVVMSALSNPAFGGQPPAHTSSTPAGTFARGGAETKNLQSFFLTRLSVGVGHGAVSSKRSGGDVPVKSRVAQAIALAAILTTAAFGQLERYDGTVLSPKGAGVPGATIAICQTGANTNLQPCTPLSSLYSWNIVASTGAARAAGTVTVTTTVPHGLAPSAAIVISGVTDSTFNGSLTVSAVLSTTQFQYLQSGSNATSGSGSVSGQNPITSDAFGNYFFFGLSGQYVIQIFSPQLSQQFVQYGVTLPCDAVTNCGSKTNNTWTGNNTFTAPVTLLGSPSLQSTGNGTQLSMQAANGTSGNTFGGLISLGTGNGIGSGNGGAFNVSLGNGGSSNGVGGSVTVTAGAGGGTGAGGNINLVAGTGTTPGTVSISGATTVTGAATMEPLAEIQV